MGGNELITKGSERVRDQAIELEQTWYALVGGQDIFELENFQRAMRVNILK